MIRNLPACIGALAVTLAPFVLPDTAAPAPAAQPITGRASVIDGDTIEIAGTRIRLSGIDAPESWQKCQDAAGAPYSCGQASAEALDAFLAASRPTTCQPLSLDRYGRTVADCQRADGQSAQSFLVRGGWALDWPKYSHGAYAGEQDAARRARRDLAGPVR